MNARPMIVIFSVVASLVTWSAQADPPAKEAQTAARRAPANVMVEISFAATAVHRRPFRDVTLDVLVDDPRGQTHKVPAFWAGGKVWKIRYASPLIGVHRYRSVCSMPSDRGLHGVSGTITIEPYTGDNPLYQHGPIRIADDRRHFAHADGTPFFWLGDTWWMGLCRRLHWPEEFEQLTADRQAKGFTVIQIVAGLYPDMAARDPRGANEAGFPWQRGFSSIRPEYFDRADDRLFYLVDQGLSPCIVGAWGYYLPWMGTDRMEQHWRYLIARYGALPVVWCAAGEGTMPFYRSEHRKEEAQLQKQGWTQVIRYIRDTDPFGRIVTIHPSRSARETVTDPTVLDFDMHQTGHRPRTEVAVVADRIGQAYRTEPIIPVISGESSYDGLDLRQWGGGVLSSAASRQMFWVCLMSNGVAGATYGANGIWQVNRAEAPYGPSPHGRSWGSVAWDQAMKRPGSQQVGLAKRFFQHYPWYRFQPQPDTVAWADGGAPAAARTVPLAAGVGRTLRVVYAPLPHPVLVKRLDANASYGVNDFDPVTGRQGPQRVVRTDSEGNVCSPLPRGNHDWVWVLQLK